MFEVFRFLKCLMTAINRGQSNAEYFSSLSAICLTLAIFYPLTMYADTLVLTAERQAWIANNWPAFRYGPLLHLPEAVVNFVIFGPMAYLLFHSRLGYEAQSRYDDAHRQFFEGRASKIRAATVLVLTVFLVAVALLSRVSAGLGIGALIVILTIASYLLRKYLPTNHPG